MIKLYIKQLINQHISLDTALVIIPNFNFTGTIVLMKQYEAVIQTLERLGGQSTLGLLYQEVMKEKNCEWKTKTPFASIRRIVQIRPEIFKVRPGLWALRSYQKR